MLKDRLFVSEMYLSFSYTNLNIRKIIVTSLAIALIKKN